MGRLSTGLRAFELLALALLSSCGRAPAREAPDLMRALARVEGVDWVLPEGAGSARSEREGVDRPGSTGGADRDLELEHLATRIERRLTRLASDGPSARLVRGESTDASRARVRIGDWDDAGLERWLRRVGVEWPQSVEGQSVEGQSAGSQSAGDEPVVEEPVGGAETRGAADERSAHSTRAPSWLGRRIDTRSDALVATFEDPARPGLPWTLIVGEASVLAARVDDLRPGWLPSARLYRGGEPRLDVRLRLDGGPRTATLREPLARWLRQPRDYARRATETGLSVLVDRELDGARVERYLAGLEAARARLDVWCPAPAEPAASGPPLILDAFADEAGEPDECVALSSWIVTRRGASDGPRGDFVHALLIGGESATEAVSDARPGAGPRARAMIDDGAAAWIRATLERRLGSPAHAWMAEAAALDACDRWWGRPLEEQVARLVRAGLRPTLAELVDPRATRIRSPHVVLPLRAILFRVLRQEALEGGRAAIGPAGLVRQWRGEEPLPDELVLERLWIDHLGGIVERVPARGDAPGNAPDGSKADPARAIAGLDGARVGAAVEAGGEGLGARPAARAIDELAAAGARLAAFDGFLTQLPDAGGMAWEREPALEFLTGDASLALAAARASEDGLARALAVHWLSSPAGTHLAQLKRTSAEEWGSFYDDFEPAWTHAALVADLAGFDWLLFGEGLEIALRTRPNAEEAEGDPLLACRARRAPALIERARALFDGGLTLRAESLRGAEAVGLWPALDCVAIALQPFAGSPDGLGPGRAGATGDARTTSRLVGALAALIERAEREGRPLLVAGAGFRATREAWRGLHHGAIGERDLLEQARLFAALEAALERLAREGRAPAALWLDRFDVAGGSRGFDLRGRPAAASAERLWAR